MRPIVKGDANTVRKMIDSNFIFLGVILLMDQSNQILQNLASIAPNFNAQKGRQNFVAILKQLPPLCQLANLGVP